MWFVLRFAPWSKLNLYYPWPKYKLWLNSWKWKGIIYKYIYASVESRQCIDCYLWLPFCLYIHLILVSVLQPQCRCQMFRNTQVRSNFGCFALNDSGVMPLLNLATMSWGHNLRFFLCRTCRFIRIMLVMAL